MSVISAPIRSKIVLAEYNSRLQNLQALTAATRTRKLWVFASIVVCAALFFAALIMALKGAGLFFPALPIMLIAISWRLMQLMHCRTRLMDLAQRSSFYERGIDRIEDNWRGKGNTGLEFARDNHLCQSGLNILGEGSLFELISTTRSEVGAERLASFLLDPVSAEEARARQDAVKELRGATGLREEVALLGKYQFQDCHAEHLDSWLNLPILRVSRIIPGFLYVSSTACLLLGLCGYGQIFHWLQIAPALASLFLAQASIALVLMHSVRVRIKALLSLGGDVIVLSQGVELLEHQQFHSTKLGGLVQRLRKRDASTTICKLRRMLIALERREDVVVYAFSLWLTAGTQLVLAIERWRASHQRDLEDWLDAWAEFEALNALGCYSWEHPTHAFPELLDESPRFEAENLSHPLLPEDRCVVNDVALNGSTAFYMISGSNMAGKSTFLRAIGLNAILAAAGGPVSATGARTAVFCVCASISIQDSLMEGKSKFLAEIERLRESIRAASEGQHVLFLIDEILAGTNSGDRKTAARAVIEALVAAGAVGALSTHDLALTEIVENPELRGINVHMQSENSDEPLAFDYKVKPGISRQANALAIVRMMGIAV